ncbi:MAG: S-layer homology domain-containing protein, partial [Dorea sp.]|nr:S-layer homology domain-containing protein [Dorea sp.]
DVAPGNWKYESVKYVYENGIMNGITNTDGTIDSFQPDEPLTRAMFATVLYRMAGQPPVAFENRFSDVSTRRYYSSAIIWAYRNGIVNGYADGSYGVDDYITREQIAKMLRIYAQVRGYSTSERADINSFPDVSDVSGWAVEHMSWAVGCGMINGKNIGGTYYLDAKGNATRVECAAMLMRFINRYGK